MRNKIKQIMNKEEGFTLVELLAVIVILGIIVAIAIPSIGNILDRADTQAQTAQDELVQDAARLYFVSNPDQSSVTATILINDGFLEMRQGDLEDLSNTTFNRTDFLNESDS